jgi:hypothetical protein
MPPNKCDGGSYLGLKTKTKTNNLLKGNDRKVHFQNNYFLLLEYIKLTGHCTDSFLVS